MKYLLGSYILDPGKQLRVIKHIDKRMNKHGFPIIDLDLECPKTGNIERVRNFPYGDFVIMYSIPDRYITEVLYGKSVKLGTEAEGQSPSPKSGK